MNGRTNSTPVDDVESVQIPLEPVTEYAIEPGDTEIKLVWTDPLDKYAAPKGQTADEPWTIASKWDHTSIVRKEGSDPQNINDGILVENISIRDQYKSTQYIDDGLINDTNYHYGLFAVNTINIPSTPVYLNATPKTGTMLMNISEGTIIKISEDGQPVEFYVAKHNYQSDLNGEGRTLVARKEYATNMRFTDPDSGIGWPNFGISDVNTWLDNTYINRFNPIVIQLIGSTKILYCTRSSGAKPGYHDEQLWIPSCTELSANPPMNAPEDEGELLPIANILLTPNQLIRSAAESSNGNRMYYINSSGSFETTTPNGCYGGVRPYFTLPNTVRIHSDGNLIESLE